MKFNFPNGSSITFSRAEIEAPEDTNFYGEYYEYVNEYKMNREQLQELIRLANNNSNENEANSAARFVCKFLADYSFPNEVSSEFDYARWCQRHRKLKANCGCK